MNARRTLGWALASVVVATVARGAGSTAPPPDAVARWCSEEQQGAIVLAEDLRRRGRALAARERAASTEGVDIQAAQARLDARMKELEALRAEIDGMLGKADAARAEHVSALVKMVEANRPAAAAPMFQKLPADLAVEVLDQMRRGKAGKLLAALPPAQAAALAERMTAPVHVPTPP